MFRLVEVCLLVACSFFIIVRVSDAVDPYSFSTGNIQIRHFLTYFLRVDNNSNLILEYSDFNKTAGRLMSVSDYKRLTPEEMYGKGGVVESAWNIFPGHSMAMPSFILAAALAATNLDDLQKKAHEICDIMFDAFDCRPVGAPDKFLSEEELGISWYTYGLVDSPFLATGFADMDFDDDDKISEYEYIDHCICYFTTHDPEARCRWILGPDDVDIKFLD